MSYWTPIEAGRPVRGGCATCPPRPALLRWKDNPDPGFGVVQLICDGIPIEGAPFDRVATTVREWRSRARQDPNHTWAIEVDRPLGGVRYTRQASGRWVATHKSMGFA